MAKNPARYDPSKTYVEKAALGHKAVVDDAVAPTCTETGLTAGKHCSVCNAVLTAQKEVPANGHIDKNKKDYYCDVCGVDLYVCSMCNTYEKYIGIPFVGMIVELVHYFVHFGQSVHVRH